MKWNDYHKIGKWIPFAFSYIKFSEIQEEGCEGMIAEYESSSMVCRYIKYIDQTHIATIKMSLQRPLPSKYTWHRRGIYVFRSRVESMVCLGLAYSL